ncbi:hypothetical protein CHS0354_013444 [Potamilus streckersoni]|uniref:Potassium channel domain-containing protein n=1 Tax=Potamilus streckersoni TaxID=2493646 RepID=A0AAE0RYH2_9BIVA|nr:hypothetical protein CHS0354_013444 [Potamilus streckersoni]
MAGASMFEHLEKENEVKECFDSLKDYHDMESMTLQSLKNVIYSLNPESDASAKRVLGVLETFGRNVMTIKYDGRDCSIYGQPDGPQYKWAWHGSLLFVVTVVSTIGYGHIAPKTVWGRIACIAYAMIGIPLTMIFLATIGNTLATMFRFMYSRIINCDCCKRRKKKPNVRKQWHVQSNDTMPEKISQRVVISRVRIVEPTDHIHFRINTRKQDVADDKTNSDTSLISMDARDPIILDPVSNLDVAQAKGKPNIYPHDIKIMTQGDMRQRNKILQDQQFLLADDNESDEEESSHGVPLTVTILIIISYIFFGVFLFAVWRDWDMLQATYFCFISLSTIGFGDLVPGTDFSLPSAYAELVFGSIYIIFGLALISMGFALMQEEFLEKTKWIGMKLGVVQDHEE